LDGFFAQFVEIISFTSDSNDFFPIPLPRGGKKWNVNE
jgi:hypothetical protein